MSIHILYPFLSHSVYFLAGKMFEFFMHFEYFKENVHKHQIYFVKPLNMTMPSIYKLKIHAGHFH